MDVVGIQCIPVGAKNMYKKHASLNLQREETCLKFKATTCNSSLVLGTFISYHLSQLSKLQFKGSSPDGKSKALRLEVCVELTVSGFPGSSSPGQGSLYWLCPQHLVHLSMVAEEGLSL